MNKTLHKKLMTECIRGWYVLDNILFGGQPDTYLKESKGMLNTYNQLKKKYLTTVFEFYVKCGYKSSFDVLPKNSNQVEGSAKIVTESLKKDLNKQFTMKQKDFCKIISEGVDPKNDALLAHRTRYFGRSMMIENFFINNPLKHCKRNIKWNAQEKTLIESCLRETRDAMLKISSKYYKEF